MIMFYLITLLPLHPPPESHKQTPKIGNKTIRGASVVSQSGDLLVCYFLVSELGVGTLHNADNDTEETEGTTEDFYDQNLDEERSVLCISQSTTTAGNTYANTICKAVSRGLQVITFVNLPTK